MRITNENAPEWLAVGSKVALIRWGWTGRPSSVTYRTVTRHTKTRVVLDNGEWLRFNEPSNARSGPLVLSTGHLHPVDSPAVGDALRDIELGRAHTRVDAAARPFRGGGTPTVEECDALMVALAQWRELANGGDA